MKYQLVLNFHIDEGDVKFQPFIEQLMRLFRETYPNAKETSESFATVHWTADGDSPKPGIGYMDKDIP